MQSLTVVLLNFVGWCTDIARHSHWSHQRLLQRCVSKHLDAAENSGYTSRVNLRAWTNVLEGWKDSNKHQKLNVWRPARGWCYFRHTVTICLLLKTLLTDLRLSLLGAWT